MEEHDGSDGEEFLLDDGSEEAIDSSDDEFMPLSEVKKRIHGCVFICLFFVALFA